MRYLILLLNHVRKVILMGVFSILLAACQELGLNNEFAIGKLVVGETSKEHVRDKVGKPEIIWEEAAGEQVWEYPFGPSGSRTYMLHFTADGKLRQVEQVLTRAYFAKIQPGMHKDEVRRLLGKPSQTMTYARKQEEVWDWRFQAEPSQQMMFNVYFDLQGKVLKTGETLPPELTDRS